MKTMKNAIEQLMTEASTADQLADLELDLVVVQKMIDDKPITENDARRFQDIQQYVYG